MYDLDFRSEVLNNKFKQLIINAYDSGADGYYTGVNNCSSCFVRAINGIAQELGVKPYATNTADGTPAGVQQYITTTLKGYYKEVTLIKTNP